MGDDARPTKARKVEQNHKVNITSINPSTMDHFCTVTISPDHLNPDGKVKRGIRLNWSEFSKGIKVLSERCNYRLLTPLSSFAYSTYLNKCTEDYLKHGTGGGPAKPVVQVFNNSPFRFKSRFFVAVCCSVGQKVFELFPKASDKGFAEEILRHNLPFQVNWSGPNVKDMKVDDEECLKTLVKMVTALEELQPNIPGLGVCSLVEFGRLLCYNLLVDGTTGENCGDSDDDDSDGVEQEAEFRGYKQLLLVLQSNQVETGKSLLADIVTRIFHGRKTELKSTISFNCAKSLLGRGEPVVIDDFNNDDIGMVLLSRASKAIWGKSQINIKNESVTPNSNILFCTNEEITNLRVEGRNKNEVYQKLSVIDLGEKQMSSDGNKIERIKDVLHLSKVIRSVLPSYFGLILQVCGEYITPDQFEEFKDVTSHERMANILKNAQNFHETLTKFCESVPIEKPNCLQTPLDTSCLTNKSELVLKFKNPEQIVNMLMSTGSEIALSEHDQKKGIVFNPKSLGNYPWVKESLSWKRDGEKIYQKMRTRKLSSEGESTSAVFLKFEFLNSSVVDKIKEFAKKSVENDPKVVIANSFVIECKRYEELKKEHFDMAETFVNDQVNLRAGGELSKVKTIHKCVHCDHVYKSKRGLTQHMKKCNKNTVK